jgi:hypothetical protein
MEEEVEEIMEELKKKEKFNKIVVLTEERYYKNLEETIRELQEAGFIIPTPMSNIAIATHLQWLRESIEEAQQLGLIKEMIPEKGEIVLNREFDEDWVAWETYGVFLGLVDNNTLLAPLYIASLTLKGIVEGIKVNALKSRIVIYDDEKIAYVYLFQHNGKYYVYKELYDESDILREYSKYEDALEDYRTVDFGWKNWTPFQALELKVKPEKEFKIDYDVRYTLWKLDKFNIENILNAMDKVKVYELSDKKLLSFWYGQEIIKLSENAFLNLGTSTIYSIGELPNEIIEKIKKWMEESYSEIEKLEKKLLTCSKKKDIYRVSLPAELDGMVAVGINSNADYVYSLDYVVKDSKKNPGKKYVLVNSWSTDEYKEIKKYLKIPPFPNDVFSQYKPNNQKV